MYGLLLDRASLSWVSGEKWRDENGDPFVIFTIEEIRLRLRCGEKKAGQLLKSLKTNQLIRTSRPKKDGPYHIVVLPFDQSNGQVRACQNDSCTDVEKAAVHPSKLRLNNTDKITLLEGEIKKHIEYDSLLSEFPREQLDSVVDVMAQTLASPAKTIPLGGIPVDGKAVKERLWAAGPSQVQYLFETLEDTTEPIRSYRAFYLARLCDPPGVVDAYYTRQHRLIFDAGPEKPFEAPTGPYGFM